jgi:hypothetical protein
MFYILNYINKISIALLVAFIFCTVESHAQNTRLADGIRSPK